MAFKTILCLIHFLVLVSALQAQDITLRGVVSDEQTGRPLEVANITLQLISGGDARGTITDSNGLYEINRLQAGEYIFVARYVGYEMHTDTLELENNVVKNLRLAKSEESLGELTVSGTHEENLVPGQIQIRGEDLGRAPTPAGSADLASYLQIQPGVVATGDRGGQLFVRGGTPSENLILMDGIMIYQPFHIVGFFSVFPEDVISSVDFYAGGFGPEYSSRTSSVMDVRLKNGNLYSQNWSASVSPFVSDFFFESPVTEGKSSVMVSLRGSLIEESSKHYLEEQQPLRFNSQLVKYSHVAEQGVNCSAFFMRTYDRGKLDFDGDDFFSWNNVVTGGGCAGVSGGSGISFMDVNFGLSYFSNNAGQVDYPGRNSSAFKSQLDVTFLQNIGAWQFEYGLFTNIRDMNYDISEQFVSVQGDRDLFLSTGGYVKSSVPLGDKFSFDPGFSFTTYLNAFKSSFEPRLQLSWQPRGKVDEEVHAAFGIYRQPDAGITDYRDAGTAFTAWMPVPDSNRRMEARHALLGWRQPVGRFLKFSAEGYYKKILNTPVSVWSTVAQFTTDIAYADGSVYGADVRLDFNHQNFYGGIGYGYSITEYETAQDLFGTWFGDPIQRYHPAHDRRHQLNVQAGLETGNFTANISWMYGSGLPFTRPMGFDSYFSFEERPPEITDNYGTPRVLLEKPFQGKMPDFHRLDVSIEQVFNVSLTEVRVQAGAINVYNVENLFYYDVFTQKGINQLPFMPYVSLKIGSK